MSKGMAASTKEKASSTKLTSNVEVLEERRASLPLAQLNANEERFFELVEKGDVAAVQSFINTNRTLNVNCVNYKGLNAMHIALKREDEAMVRVFFGRPDLEVRDSALHAVATGNTDLTATVLDLIKCVLSLLNYFAYSESQKS
ncbi:short transient receptor potential channel 6 [Caerostris darwini]|uniref:Short transient receptor potential channel 6 n=1 Tax=Caerostris darwini TaxID=1538125 RepID=A0AAV4R0W0_9ARAC|nr:short transient receptor potential channel 6 [Caerostris darwini]